MRQGCVKDSARPVKFWAGNKVVLNAFPTVNGTVMGYYPHAKAYHLLLAGDGDHQFPEALRERLYSPAGMPGQNRMEVAAEEMVLCAES